MQFLTDRLPITIDVNAGFQKELLQGLVELSDSLVFVNSDVTLQAFDRCLCGSGDCVREFRLATTRRPLDQKWSPHLGREIDDGQDGLINDVSRSEQPIRKVSWRREHGACSAEKVGWASDALTMYEVSSTDFLSEKPHFLYGAAQRPSTADRKTHFAN